MDFERRCKDAEAKFSERINDMKKQLDNRWKQIDKFEASLKTYAETKAGWKKKLFQKEGEVEALKVLSSPNLFMSLSQFLSLLLSLRTVILSRNWHVLNDLPDPNQQKSVH